MQNHAVLLRYLAPNCREEVKAYLNKRSESPPIAAEKRKQGRVRARFYNNSAQPSPPPVHGATPRADIFCCRRGSGHTSDGEPGTRE